MKEKNFIIILDKLGHDRMRTRIVIIKGRIKYFVVQYEAFVRYVWHAVVRYDLTHGFFHRDVLKPNGEKEKQSINIHNLEEALIYAQQDIKHRWQFYRERYVKQYKNEK